MPQFTANPSFLLQDVDLLARYNAAADVGFCGVETPFPYSVPPEALATRLQSCGLAQMLCMESHRGRARYGVAPVHLNTV